MESGTINQRGGKVISIGVKVEGIERIKAMLGNQIKQINYATAVALTNTAKAVREALPAAMESSLDRPTSFTKRGLFLRAARKDNLEAVVGFMDRQARYMRYQIEGGQRPAGPGGIKLPGNISLNAFGNIPKGAIDQLKAAAKGGSLSRTIARRLGEGNRRKGAAPIELFFGQPRGKGWANAPVGIWRRVPGLPGKLVPVVVFPKTSAKYRPRFDMAGIARRVVEREWPRQFEQALRMAKATAR